MTIVQIACYSITTTQLLIFESYRKDSESFIYHLWRWPGSDQRRVIIGMLSWKSGNGSRRLEFSLLNYIWAVTLTGSAGISYDMWILGGETG